VNLFIASELDWPEQGVKLRQETKYPVEPTSRLTLACKEPVTMDLKLRHPYWAVSGIEIVVNGQKEAITSKPGSYATISRQWRDGDRVEIKMPMSLRTEGFRDNPQKVAILYGPLVLCAQCGAGSPAPAIVGEPGQIVSSIRQAEESPLAFQVPSTVFRTGAAGPSAVMLMPFYREYQRPYIVYWDVLDEAQWKAKTAAYEAEIARGARLRKRTVDEVLIGNRASESKHALKGQRMGSDEFGGRLWRHATGGGWFAYEMKVLPDKPVELLVSYWGGDAGGREFDILVNGTKIATQKLERNRPDQFYDEVYAIPTELTKGKEKVTVRFQAHPGRTAGGIFDCRVLKKE
jgi:hypothetical protein